MSLVFLDSHREARKNQREGRVPFTGELCPLCDRLTSPSVVAPFIAVKYRCEGVDADSVKLHEPLEWEQP